jgi:hypothetical protein
MSSDCCSEKVCCKTVSALGWIFVIAVGVAVVSMLPEIKRYIKISSM